MARRRPLFAALLVAALLLHTFSVQAVRRGSGSSSSSEESSSSSRSRGSGSSSSLSLSSSSLSSSSASSGSESGSQLREHSESSESGEHSESSESGEHSESGSRLREHSESSESSEMSDTERRARLKDPYRYYKNKQHQELSKKHELKWGYESKHTDGVAGPDDWDELFKGCTGGLQSPIDLVGDDAPVSKAVKFNWGTDKTEGKLINDGHVVILTDINQDKSSTISDGPFDDGTTGILHHIIFHWGATGKEGSEHQLDGHRFAGEVQFFYYNSDYASYKEAADQFNGLVAVALLLSADDNKQNGVLQNIVSVLPKIGGAHSTHAAPAFSWGDLFNGDFAYIAYKGQDSKPPCSRPVHWLVGTKPIDVSKAQLDAFRALCAEPVKNGQKCSRQLTRNFRPPQPFGDLTHREVKVYPDPAGESSLFSNKQTTIGQLPHFDRDGFEKPDPAVVAERQRKKSGAVV